MCSREISPICDWSSRTNRPSSVRSASACAKAIRNCSTRSTPRSPSSRRTAPLTRFSPSGACDSPPSLAAPRAPAMSRFLTQSAEFLPILLMGVKLTILVTIGSLAVSTVLGLIWALMRVSGIRVLAAISRTIINIIRGIPIIVQLFYIYFVLPDFGITLSALQAAIIGLGIAYSAYQAENFRAGIEAIDHGQVEAAQSIGMGWSLMMRRVILPQAVRIVLPPYGNTMIMMLKDSSQASTITVAELALQGKLIASATFQNSTVFTLVALLYLTMSIPLILLVGWLEKRFGRKS